MKIKRLTILFILFSLMSFSYAQEDINYDVPRKEDLKYYKKREALTYPTYGLSKIKELIVEPHRRLPKDEMPFEFNVGISDSDFIALSTKEKFTYCLVNPEMFTQNCAEQMYYYAPEKKIFADLIAYYPSQFWSKRQLDFFVDNRTTCLALFEETLKTKKHLGMNLKGFLIELNAWEEIPTLIDYYKKHPTDNDVLTILLLLMKEGSYSALYEQMFYKDLFDNEDYFTRWIPADEANVNKILDMAQQFYKSQTN